MAYCMSVLYSINDYNYITSSVSICPDISWLVIEANLQTLPTKQHIIYKLLTSLILDIDDLGIACFFFSSYLSTSMIKTVFVLPASSPDLLAILKISL